jgi:hypothetical protein
MNDTTSDVRTDSRPAETAATTSGDEIRCCGPAIEAACCEPEAKAACCGETLPGSCGCA